MPIEILSQMEALEKEEIKNQPIGHMAREAGHQESRLQEKAEIEQDMLNMAKGMKQFAYSFKD